MNKLKNFMLLSLLFISYTTYAEPFVTSNKIISNLGKSERLESLVPCSLAKTETLCAIINTGNTTADEFRVYTYEKDLTHTPKIIFSFQPGTVGKAQNFIGSKSTDSSLLTYWSPGGTHPEGVITIEIKLNSEKKYTANVLSDEISTLNDKDHELYKILSCQEKKATYELYCQETYPAYNDSKSALEELKNCMLRYQINGIEGNMATRLIPNVRINSIKNKKGQFCQRSFLFETEITTFMEFQFQTDVCKKKYNVNIHDKGSNLNPINTKLSCKFY